MFYLYSNPDHSNDCYQPLAAPHLEGLAGQLININDRWGSADLTADYWPEVYWSNPDSFTLDDDEKAPEQREATEEIVLGIAKSVWDTAHAHITGRAHHTTLDELVEFIAERCDLTHDGARNTLETYKKQIEDLDEKEIDDEAIADDDAEFLATCAKMWTEEASAVGLYAVGIALSNYNNLDEDSRGEAAKFPPLCAAIREAANAGYPRAEIALAADLSQSAIFKILRETT